MKNKEINQAHLGKLKLRTDLLKKITPTVTETSKPVPVLKLRNFVEIKEHKLHNI